MKNDGKGATGVLPERGAAEQKIAEEITASQMTAEEMTARIHALESGILTLLEEAAQRRSEPPQTVILQLAPPQATKSGRGGRKPAKAVLDLKTGIVYRALNECGTALAGEFGVPLDSWSWYGIQAMDKARFIKEPTEKQIAEAQARIAKESGS